ncbi:MAG TPA: TIM barrel protein [Vicinamibacterales bacterium]|nr:TIM barrel protein [Vicinamibacterales bacterium]
MSELNRREFLAAAAALPHALRPAARGAMKIGYAAITWGGDDARAIREVAEAGFRGIQLRATAFDAWGSRPADLKALLAKHRLAFPVMSSGNLKYAPEERGPQIALHLKHAEFVRDAGGGFLQVIDEKPKGRAIARDDYRQLGAMLRRLGDRTAEIGVPLVYHHHMNSTGEAPEAIEAILEDIPGRSVGLLFDIAHYQQGGGDPVAFIRRFGKAIRVVHLKDVRPIETAPGYQWVELGRGRVDVKGCVAALKDNGFDGWAIVELDRVVDPGGSPKASALANREYVTKQLGLAL